MAIEVETLIVKIEGDLSDLRKDFKKSAGVVQQGASKMSKSARQATTSFGGLGKSAIKLAATIGLVGIAFKSIRSIFSEFGAVDVLAKTADRLGITTEALVGLQFAAGQTGVESNVLATSLQRLNRRLSEVATTGGGVAAKGLKQLGLTAEDLLRLPLEQQFGLIGDRLNKISSQADRTAIAFGFFDTEGGKLLNTLRVGTKGLEEFRQEAQDLGIAISRVDAAKIEAANDTLDKLSQSFIGAARDLAIGLAPAIDFVGNEFLQMNKDASQSTPIIDAVAKGLVGGFRFAQISIAGARAAINAAIVGFGKLGEIATEAAILAIRGFRRLQAGMTGIVIVAVDISDAFVKTFQFIANIANETWAVVRTGGDIVAATLLLAFESAADGVNSIVRGIKVAFAAALDVAATVVAAGAGFIDVREGLSADLINAAGDLRLANIRERTAAESGVTAAKTVLDQSVDAFKAAQAELLTGDAPPGSELLQQISADLGELAQAQLDAATTGDAVTESLGENLAIIRQFITEGEAALDAAIDEGGQIGSISAALEEFEKLREIREQAFQAEIDQRLNRDQILADIDARATANRLALEQEASEKAIIIAQKEAEAKARLDEAQARTRLAGGRQFLSDLATLTSSESRKAFAVGKAAALAEAGVNTFLAATKAYQSLAGIPVVGPALGAVAAAAAIAAGVINIQKIRQMQFGGGGAGAGAAVPSTAASTGGGGGGAPAGGGGGGGGPIQSQQFNITLQGERFSGQQVRDLIESINDQLGDNATLQVG